MENDILSHIEVTAGQNIMASEPPYGLPRYRFFTGPDDAAFCYRVSEAIELGYQLYGSPAITHNGTQVCVAQAVLWGTNA